MEVIVPDYLKYNKDSLPKFINVKIIIVHILVRTLILSLFVFMIVKLHLAYRLYNNILLGLVATIYLMQNIFYIATNDKYEKFEYSVIINVVMNMVAVIIFATFLKDNLYATVILIIIISVEIINVIIQKVGLTYYRYYMDAPGFFYKEEDKDVALFLQQLEAGLIVDEKNLEKGYYLNKRLFPEILEEDYFQNAYLKKIRSILFVMLGVFMLVFILVLIPIVFQYLIVNNLINMGDILYSSDLFNVAFSVLPLIFTILFILFITDTKILSSNLQVEMINVKISSMSKKNSCPHLAYLLNKGDYICELTQVLLPAIDLQNFECLNEELLSNCPEYIYATTGEYPADYLESLALLEEMEEESYEEEYDDEYESDED